jgi:hypothetical protein
MGLDEMVKTMNLEDALRKVINDSEEDLLAFSERVVIDFWDLLSFVNEGKKLTLSKMEKLRDNLNNEDYKKLQLLLNR